MDCWQWESDLDGIDNMNLRVVKGSVFRPAAGKVLVKIHSVSLNYKDGETINGFFKHHKSIKAPEHLVPCSDCAGKVVAVGEGVTKWAEGDRVLSVSYPTYLTGQISEAHLKTGIGASEHGVLAQYRIFDDYGLVATPSFLTDDEACNLQIAGTTAWMAVNGMRPLGSPGGKGEVILIQGTGGVSICGLLIAKASGAEVIITSSSDEKLERAGKLGADHLINYRKTPDWDEEVLHITGGRGVDIIFENGGAQTTGRSFNCIAFGGLVNSIGYVSGKIDPPDERLNINVLAIKKNLTLKGLLNGPRDRFEELLRFCELHQIRPVVDKVFAFDEAKEALHYLWKGSHFGKVVIKVAS